MGESGHCQDARLELMADHLISHSINRGRGSDTLAKWRAVMGWGQVGIG